jgi:LEA14-like dessication related protein
MSNVTKFILAAGGVLTFFYYRISKAVKSLVLSFRGLTLEVIAADYIRLGILLDVENSSSVQIEVEKIDLQLIINGRYVGNLNNWQKQYVPANRTSQLFFTVDLLYDAIGGELFNLLKSGTGTNFNYTFDIRGVIYFNGLPVPVPGINIATTSIQDLINKFNYEV